ncbi:hypothetical protein L1286_01835 [Pseudoalteromonas sp. SMS1]|nr:hypothetical protein [Pseudoalteromonas sp. SMS1]MCF2856202.1 hypothetical protein [Pseudoalteromonas sp. SMS1]
MMPPTVEHIISSNMDVVTNKRFDLPAKTVTLTSPIINTTKLASKADTKG